MPARRAADILQDAGPSLSAGRTFAYDVGMLQQLTITTGARLHFGLFAHKPSSGREFGGVGMMIDAPRFSVRMAALEGERDEISAPPPLYRRIEECVRRYRQHEVPGRPGPRCKIDTEAEIPQHAGFGSGTQLALAVAQGLALLSGDGTATIVDLAARVQRGGRSAIGVHGFGRGGLLIDGGKKKGGGIGTVVARIEFPDAWHWLCVTPPHDDKIAGDLEQAAFDRLPPMPGELTARLCKIAVMRLAPAVAEADFFATAAAFSEFGRSVGEYFTPVQGGVFRHPAMTDLARELSSIGFQGIVQTSWGPTVGILCPTRDAAHSLAHRLSADTPWQDCQFTVAAGLNTGAVIETKPPERSPESTRPQEAET